MLATYIKKQVLNWVLDTPEVSLFEQVLLDKPETVLSVTRLPYSGMVIRFVDGREAEVADLPVSFMDQLVGFDRDMREPLPTWVNIFSIVAINAAIETRALRALNEVAYRLGYELREKPRDFIARLEELRGETPDLAFVDEDDDRSK
jgi:hypothetical protein